MRLYGVFLAGIKFENWHVFKIINIWLTFTKDVINTGKHVSFIEFTTDRLNI